MLHIDKRGRIRFTTNGTRYEINRKGEIRTYKRIGNNERKAGVRPVNVNDLYGNTFILGEAVRTHLYGRTR